MNDNHFCVELSSFIFVSGFRTGKALRLTVTWRFTHPEWGILGESLDGCIVTRDMAGRLHFAPPLSKFGPRQSKQIAMFTKDYHDLILKHVKESGYADHIGQDIPAQMKNILPEEIDPSLPLEYRIEDEKAEIEKENTVTEIRTQQIDYMISRAEKEKDDDTQ